MKFSYNFLNKLLMLLILSYQPYNYCPFELCKGKNIIEAARNGEFAVVQCCIARGDNVNIADQNGYSPLMMASLKGYGGIVDLLIKAGAHIDAASKDGATALRFAASRGRNDIVDLLIKAGAHVNAAPLRGAAHYGHNDTVNLLIRAHAKVNATSKDGGTALITTIQGGGLSEKYQNTVNLLIKAGANVYSRQDGKTALQWAEERRQLAEKGGYKESAANIVALLQPSSIKQSLLSVINTKTDLTLLKIFITNAVEELEKLNDVVTLNEQQLQTYIYYKEIFLIFAQRIAKEIIRALYTHHPGEYKSDVLEAGDLTTKDIFIPKDVSSVIITKGIINHYNDKLYDLVLRNVRGLKYVNQQTQKEELKPDITFAQKVEENIKTMLAAFIIKEK